MPHVRVMNDRCNKNRLVGVMVLWRGLSVHFFSFFRLSLFNVLVFLAIQKLYHGNRFFRDMDVYIFLLNRLRQA